MNYKRFVNSVCEAIKEKADKAAVNTRDEFVSTLQIQILKSINFLDCMYLYSMTFSLRVDNLSVITHLSLYYSKTWQ